MNSLGDTMFLNTVKAYNALNTSFQNQLKSMQGVYSYLKLRPVINGSYDGLTEEQVAKMNGTVHPLITMHPETGEYNIYANPGHTTRIVGTSKDVSDGILAEVFRLTEQPEFTYRHKWSQYDLVMWDNRGKYHGTHVDAITLLFSYCVTCLLACLCRCAPPSHWLSRHTSQKAGAHHSLQRPGASATCGQCLLQ